MRLLLEGVRQSYDNKTVLADVGLVLEAGRIGCLLGASGCGKTTVLRCIAGFEELDSGSIQVGGTVLSEPGHHVAPERRGVGMVFQHHALFGHLSVAGNVAFGLRALTGAERDTRVRDMLALTGLSESAEVFPHQLSGGQRQRVALARALAPQPSLLLLDEPFSNLDQDLRYRLSAEVRDILRGLGTTALLVTHDQHEAFAMADEIGVMHEGRIEQWDTPWNLYHRPRSCFVAGFIGRGVLVPGEVLDTGAVRIELGVMHGECVTPAAAGDRVDVLLRPDDIVHDEASDLKAQVRRKDFRGANILYTLQLASGTRVLALVPSHHDHRVGEEIGIRLAATHIVAFPL